MGLNFLRLGNSTRRNKNRKKQMEKRRRRRLFAEGLEDRRLLAVVNFVDSITTSPAIPQPFTEDAALATVNVGTTTYNTVSPPVAVGSINPANYLYAQSGTDPGSAVGALLSPNITDFVFNVGGQAEFDFDRNLDGETFFIFDFGGGEPITAVPLDANGSVIPGDTATVPFTSAWPTVATWTSNLGGTVVIAGAAITFQGVTGVEGIKLTQAGFGTGSADIHVFASGSTASPVNYDFTLASYSASEGDSTASTAVVNITRDDSTAAETVDVVLTGGSATVGTDFTAGPVTVSFAAGESTKSVPIEILGEALVEGDETINLSLTNFSGSGQVGSTLPTSVLTIANDDRAILSISNATLADGNSGNAQLVFNVSLSNPVSSDVSFDYTRTSKDDESQFLLQQVNFGVGSAPGK